MVELDIQGLGRTFRNGAETVHAVRDVDLHIPSGSFTVVIGASGCGKTTLLKLIAGLEKPDSGTIRFHGFQEAKEEKRRKPRFGFMFQDARLLPWLTVEANLFLAFPQKNQANQDEIVRVLERVGLGAWRKAYPRQLSGGMAQRAALARALCRDPDIFLLDEPFGALDALTRYRLRRELYELYHKVGIPFVLVTHDIEEAVYLADRIVVMKEGRVDGEIPVRLARPRDYRNSEFQDVYRLVEKSMDL